MKANRGVSLVITLLTVVISIAILAALARAVGVYFFAVLLLILLVLYRKEILPEPREGYPRPETTPRHAGRGPDTA